MALSYLPSRRLRRLQQHATVGPLQGSFRGHKLIKVNDQQMNVTSPLHKLRLGANRPVNCSDEGLTLETSAFLLFTVANLRFQPSC